MIKKKKILESEDIPEFEASIEAMPEDSRIFVDKSLEIASYIFQVMEKNNLKQKDLADAMGKSEAEISKWLTGMHNYTLRSLSKLEAALGETVICTPRKYSMRLTYGARNKPEVLDKVINRVLPKFQPNEYAKVVPFYKKSASVRSEALVS